jgi:hypothetical protein
MAGFHSLYYWCFQPRWLFSGAPENPEDETVLENHCAKARNSAVNSGMHTIQANHNDTPQDAAHQLIHIATHWTRRGCPESKLAYGKPLDGLLKENTHLFDLECTVHWQTTLITIEERFTSRRVFGAWWVYR